MYLFEHQVSGKGNLVVSGLQLGNIWITVQPLLGVEGDPMRLLFVRCLTPHPQYCAALSFSYFDALPINYCALDSLT
jgi:cobalamin biosynthesis Mg chelatase CobN